MTLEDKRNESLTKIKQFFNTRQRYKKTTRLLRLKMQLLLKCLNDHKYLYKCRMIHKSKTKTHDTFWAHPKSIKMFNTFSSMLLMDSTYKPNQYQMLLFENVGVTSIEMTYLVGFAFIKFEIEDHLAWGL